MIVYDLRHNVQQNSQLGKDGAFWKWLGNFATSLVENSSDILNSIFGGGTSDTVNYITYTQPKSQEEYDTLRKQNNSGGSNSNMLLYVGIGSVVVLGGVLLLTRDKKRR